MTAERPFLIGPASQMGSKHELSPDPTCHLIGKSGQGQYSLPSGMDLLCPGIKET